MVLFRMVSCTLFLAYGMLEELNSPRSINGGRPVAKKKKAAKKKAKKKVAKKKASKEEEG